MVGPNVEGEALYRNGAMRQITQRLCFFFPPYLWKVTNEETGCKGRKLIRETVVFPSFAGAAVPPYSCFPCNHAFL